MPTTVEMKAFYSLKFYDKNVTFML